MWLRIIDIDMDASRVHLEVVPGHDGVCFASLDAFVTRCAEEGVKDVRLYHSRRTSKANKKRLSDFASMKRLATPASTPSRTTDSIRGCFRFRADFPRRRPGGISGRPPARYRLCVEGLERAMEMLHTMTALVSASEDLDPRSTLLLRLCVYELGQNTVEHGTFTGTSPSIRLGLRFCDDMVSVEYADNADVFLPDSPENVDLVEERINSRAKRGLGLYMLNKICMDFKYERIDDWNTTSFKLDMIRECETVKE
ncbi:MAG: ATP-binding protein [Candidatus Latescibacterota bacterium]|jgi:hypothetical protein